MEKIISSIMAFFFMILAVLGIRIDDKHSSTDQMISLVTSSIGEQVEFVEKVTKDNVDTYTFKLPKRNDAVFNATSKLVETPYPNTNASRLVEEISISYEQGIMESNVAKRTILAAANGVVDIPLLNGGNSTITVDDYSDISKLATYIHKLDSLYKFNEKKPANINHITWGKITFDKCTIEGGYFSTSDSNRLTEAAVRDQIVSSYVRMLKANGATDSKIPKEVWNSYR